MGRPYLTELEQLPATIKWASEVEITGLRRAAEAGSHLPLLAIGSGGSLTAAHLLASLHRNVSGRQAAVATPLAAQARLDPAVSVWLLSGGGSNVDILNAFDFLAGSEPDQLTVVCGRRQSRLTVAASKHKFVELFDAEGPVHKDGFLATNSLISAAVLVTRAYCEAFEGESFLDQLTDFVSQSGHLESLRASMAPLWSRDTLIVLHGPATAAAAVDLESKFTEAALGHVQLADYRNFAHGRHHWLAKRGAESGVLALAGPDDQLLATKTLSLIPKRIPTVRFDFSGGFSQVALTSMFTSLHVAGWAGKARRIDPGRPGVPEFGRKLFRLGARSAGQRFASSTDSDSAAIEKKTRTTISVLEKRGDVEYWRQALEAFKRQMSEARFGAVVFDYDGTLVDARDRFIPPRPEIVGELRRFLSGGLVVGVATGRGASVRRDLQKCIPEALWPRVLIGYYNGAEVASLASDTCPDGSSQVKPMLMAMRDALTSHPELKTIATISVRPWQITVESKNRTASDRMWDLVNQVAQVHLSNAISVVRSSHSVDVLAPGVSKSSILTRIAEMLAADLPQSVLTIGDRGRWPGNDFVLLGERYSLSVDEVSVDPQTCWNLAPKGYRGPQVTLEYCRSLKRETKSGGWRFVMAPWRSA